MSRLLASLVFQDIKVGTGIVKVDDQISRVLYTLSRYSKINENKMCYSYKIRALNRYMFNQYVINLQFYVTAINLYIYIVINFNCSI
jgi:hypothetical protein